jgi:cytochrome c oxidase subunit 3
LSETNARPAHQFDDLGQQHEAASLGMWAFLATEILFFGGLFLLYAVYRTLYPVAFSEGSRHLDIMLGSINTAVLIGSSLTMVLAVHSAQLGRRRAIVAFLAFTMLLGIVFLSIKFVEYGHKFEQALVPGPRFAYDGALTPQVQLFFSFYFIMTGLHALHMVIGIGLLAVLAWLAWHGKFSPAYHTPVEITGLYWHFVDVIWMFLFPLLYLLGRHG